MFWLFDKNRDRAIEKSEWSPVTSQQAAGSTVTGTTTSLRPSSVDSTRIVVDPRDTAVTRPASVTVAT